ncbi:MAG: phosphatidate cytidylyltransferase [Betaproteobacteria bacterium AqS2]|uniref:Phosphatidate cytidylyltransferase n=1 Tax=Candidatus Amphirhobacter heronislandensis TaxID=1732024 RepID=A0A930XY81_9GAMM|nr:phosphatidate cytidylyltransferase [Betaproteobacteria bacterium AqS2]
MNVAAAMRGPGKTPMGIILGIAFGLLLLLGNNELITWIGLAALGMAGWELASLQKRRRRQRLGYVAALLVAALLSRWILAGNRGAVDEFFFLAALLWAFLGPLFLIQAGRPRPGMVAALGALALVSAWLSLAVLVEYDRWLLIGGVAGVCLGDWAASAAGRRLGSRPLAPAISPNKTWEGALAALLVLYLYATALWWLFLRDGGLQHWLFLLLGAAVAALGVLGDLVVSRLKRLAGVKDSGVLLGSHGGLLDRVDSWLPVLPFLALVSTLLAS